jgi:hypothetical protein
MNSNNIVNLQNPMPILQQPKSSITTNTLIPNPQGEFDYETLDVKEFDKMNKEYDAIKKNNIKYTSFATIHAKISESVIGIITECYDKPKNIGWVEHIKNTFTKDERYSFIGILFIVISIIIYIIRLTLNDYKYRKE